MSIKDLPTLIEAYAEKRDERLVLQRRTDQLKKEETQLKDDLILALQEANLTSAGGTDHKVTYKQETKPVAGDWNEIYRYIQENDAWDLMQRRLLESAIKERWEDGVEIPGVVSFPVDKLSLSKA